MHANWAITTSSPSLKGDRLGLAYGIYAGFAVLSFVFVRRVITETNGRELEAMPEQVTVPPGPKVLRDRRSSKADDRPSRSLDEADRPLID